MGGVAGELSDFSIITSDNPRSENPIAVIEEIACGFRSKSHRYQLDSDRETGVRKILGMAEPGDVVILAGKGHETYQVLADRIVHFDDREMARTVLREMGHDRESVSS